MPGTTEFLTAEVMANGSSNGVNGEHRPSTPPTTSNNISFSLTEYSATPMTPPDEKREKLRKAVPEDFLLPNGYPDVS
jgi:threonine dehydratase